MMVHLIPSAERRRRLLPKFLGSCQSYCLRYGEVQTEELHATAAWLPPGTTATLGRMLRSGMITSSLALGPAGMRRMLRLTSAMDREHHRQAPDPHWYLWLLATEPAHVGRGAAGRVLAPTLARADTKGMPVYLDTHNERNLAFYARHGFEPVAEDKVDGCRFWGLLRQPTSR